MTEHDTDPVTRHDLDNLEKAMTAGFRTLRERMDARFTEVDKAGELAAKEIERRQVEMNQFREEQRKDERTYVKLDLYRSEKQSQMDKTDKIEEKLNGEIRGIRGMIGAVALLLIATLAGVVVDIASR